MKHLFLGFIAAMVNALTIAFHQPRGLVNLANEAGVHDGSLTRSAEEAITARGYILKAGTAADEVSLCDAGERPLFVSLRGAAIDELVAVAPLSGNVIRPVIAAGAITVGADVYAVGAGKVDVVGDAASGDYRVGVAVTAAAADGDEVEVAFDAIETTKA